MKKALAVAFCVDIADKADETTNKAINNAIDEIVNGNENKEIIDVKEFFDKFSKTNNLFFTPSQQIIFVPIGDKEDEIDKTGKSLEKLFEKAYKDDEVVKEIIDAKAYDLWKLPIALTKKDIVLSMGDLKIKSEQLYVKNKMYISENEALQLHLLQQHHNSPIHSHLGYKMMYRMIQANYF